MCCFMRDDDADDDGIFTTVFRNAKSAKNDLCQFNVRCIARLYSCLIWFYQATTVFSNLFIGVETFRRFRLLAEPHAVTQGFVAFRMDRSITFLFIMHEKTPMDTSVCNTVTVA